MNLRPGTVEVGGRSYKTLTFEDNKIDRSFMIENLDLDVGAGCCYYNNDSSNAAQYGRLYTWEAAQAAAPHGWEVIAWPRWELLQRVFLGGSGAGCGPLMQGGSSGLNFKFGGRRDPNTKDFLDIGEMGYYWSANDQPQDVGQLYIFESPSKGGRYREWEWPKGSMLSVRFYREQSLIYPNMHT